MRVFDIDRRGSTFNIRRAVEQVPDRVHLLDKVNTAGDLSVYTDAAGTRYRRRWTSHSNGLTHSDVQRGQLLDVVEGRTAEKPKAWLENRGEDWLSKVRYATLDLSVTCKSVFDATVPHAVQVADPFHVVKHATFQLDRCRRRVQQEPLGHRGRKGDPPFRARRLLAKAYQRLDERCDEKLTGLLEAGDPNGQVRMAWHTKESVREVYTHTDAELALAFVDELVSDMADKDMPTEVRSLGRSLKRWRLQIAAWHTAQVTNGPTEAVNNLIKRVKLAAFGFTSFRNYRVRSLLYAGKLNWSLLATITPR